MDYQRQKKITKEAIDDVVENIFKIYDEEHKNLIDFSHFRKMIDDLNLQPQSKVTQKEINDIFVLLDTNGDGLLSKE
jgi:Ca2+-binding EF-hand superfamily protein